MCKSDQYDNQFEKIPGPGNLISGITYGLKLVKSIRFIIFHEVIQYVIIRTVDAGNFVSECLSVNIPGTVINEPVIE